MRWVEDLYRESEARFLLKLKPPLYKYWLNQSIATRIASPRPGSV